MKKQTTGLLEKLNWKYRDKDLYERALTHSSYAHEHNQDTDHNERLEFLGDAVLELIITDYLFKKYSHFSEGELTKLRAELVCEISLAQIAFRLNIGDYLFLGRGEASYGGASRPALLADTVEALIGALYLDLGFERCYEYVIELYDSPLKKIDEGELRRDYKSLIQEYSQARFGITPVYRIVEERGPDHEKEFVAQLILNSKTQGSGSGKSKKEAEQQAACEAWKAMT